MNELESTLARVTWKTSSTIEKAYFVNEAKLTGKVVIFTDLDQSPLWEDIDDADQLKLANAMQKVMGG